MFHMLEHMVFPAAIFTREIKSSTIAFAKETMGIHAFPFYLVVHLGSCTVFIIRTVNYILDTRMLLNEHDRSSFSGPSTKRVFR